ncbi:hypothetical protein FA09DRAFT_330596 [Tilletiopsis washingtonensis]|uniref:Uncharacterized protein n=1 Tax=Tilletiopsis washingtonensis TaxID=58919 RepID=A0A316Z854_9BASI|nr:hypothetical protein FA09DRAFT_330596 [Tilletiopsis washingtonensis]PWN97436.1 hypothetical protein FA09DRAFT_330596 [Tilletiopsis washingtonensis]
MSGPSSDQLAELVHSLVPSTRRRRGESDAAVRERRALRADLLDLVHDIFHSELSSSPAAEEHEVTDAIRRKLTRYAVDGGHGTGVRFETLLSKLKSQPSRPRNLNAVLELLQHLSFSAQAGDTAESSSAPRRSAAPPAPAAFALDVPSMVPAARSSAPVPPPAPELESRPVTRSDAGVPARAPVRPARVEEADVSTGLPIAKAEVVRRWRERKGRAEVPETELLRDVIYLLQGINGKHVGFEVVQKLPSTEVGVDQSAERLLRIRFEEGERVISPSTRHLVHRIAELGRLYRRISEFAQQQQTEETGLIKQSLCHFISSELTDYYRLIAVLEAHLNRTLQAVGGSAKPVDGSDEPGRIEGNPAAEGLTLKRVAVWTQDVALRLRLLSTIIESCQDAHGGALVSLIHSYTFNGDPFIRKFTAQLLEEVSKPFFHSLSRWIYEGELQDPFCEFFVELSAEARASANANNSLPSFEDVDAVSLWQSKFKFRQEMLPSFLSESFGRKIFSTGKSLNFIRYSCGDSDWISTRNKLSNSGTDLRYTDLAGLEQTIDSAYSIASTRLLDIFLDKFKLMEHLRALKDYLMLNRGDFIDRLMEALGPSLARPAASLLRHNLTASLETAIRGSNAQHDDADVLRRLDARILEFSAGDTGWDTFVLEYKVESPINTVLDAQAMLSYQTIFSHLWRIKRVELTLSLSWGHLVTAANMLRRSKKAEPELKALYKHAHRTLVLLGEMIHFVRQMQGFCQLEVIDYSWHDLQSFFAKRQGDLDDLIKSHREYLDALVSKALLRGAKRSVDTLAHEVRSNFESMLAFAAASDDLASHLTGELARHDLRAPLSSRSAASSAPAVPAARAQTVPSILARVDEHARAYEQRTQTRIVPALAKHGNLTIRGLATRLGYDARPSPAGSATPAPARRERSEHTQAAAPTPAAAAA